VTVDFYEAGTRVGYVGKLSNGTLAFGGTAARTDLHAAGASQMQVTAGQVLVPGVIVNNGGVQIQTAVGVSAILGFYDNTTRVGYVGKLSTGATSIHAEAMLFVDGLQQIVFRTAATTEAARFNDTTGDQKLQMPVRAGANGGVMVGNPTTGAGAWVRGDGSLQCVLTATNGSILTSANLVVTRAGPPVSDASGVFIDLRRSASNNPTPGVSVSNTIVNSTANGIIITNCTATPVSDPRTKIAVGPRTIPDAAARIQQLGSQAFRGFNVHADTGEPVGELRDLLFATDIDVVAPYAVIGEPDAEDEDGNPIYQNVDYMSLTPLVIAAVANALDRLDALEGATS
jgi:hypothetical protein